MQASFRKKYDYGYFYFRGSSHVEEKLQGIEPSRKDSILSLYKPESDYAARKLRELKQQTIDTGLLELVTVLTVTCIIYWVTEDCFLVDKGISEPYTTVCISLYFL